MKPNKGVQIFNFFASHVFGNSRRWWSKIDDQKLADTAGKQHHPDQQMDAPGPKLCRDAIIRVSLQHVW